MLVVEGNHTRKWGCGTRLPMIALASVLPLFAWSCTDPPKVPSYSFAAPDDTAAPDDSAEPEDTATPDDTASPALTRCAGFEGEDTPLSTLGLIDQPDAILTTLCGGTSRDRFGRHITTAGDVDGDGLADILISADRAEGSAGEYRAGKTHLLMASRLPASGSLDISDSVTSWAGEDANDLLGHTAVGAGDMDGDGTPDLAIAGYHADDMDGTEQGRVYIVGSTPSVSLADANWIFGGTQDFDHLGHGLASAGDVDGDGLHDLIMGACCGDLENPGPGMAWLVLGGSLGEDRYIDLAEHTPSWDGETDDDAAGFKVSSAGDVDGDGLSDFVVNASHQHAEFPTESGKVYLLLGASVDEDLAGHLADADVVISGTEPAGRFGYDSNSAGDIDGDGLDDLVVGAIHVGFGSQSGGAYVFYADSMLAGDLTADLADMRFTSSVEKQALGNSVEGDLDLDGDGRSELVLGAPGMAPPTLEDLDPEDVPEGLDSPGDVYLFWGSDLASGIYDVSDAPIHIEGTARNEHAGISVNNAGDVDGDGVDDLLIGTESGQMGVGRAYLLIGLQP